MRFEDLAPEQLERAKKCETHEEREAFLHDNGIELTDDQLAAVSGGKNARGGEWNCLGEYKHKFRKTGVTRPGKI